MTKFFCATLYDVRKKAVKHEHRTEQSLRQSPIACMPLNVGFPKVWPWGGAVVKQYTW